MSSDVEEGVLFVVDVLWDVLSCMTTIINTSCLLNGVELSEALEIIERSGRYAHAVSLGVDVGVRNLGLCLTRCWWKVDPKLKKKDIRVRSQVLRWQRVDIQDPEGSRLCFPQKTEVLKSTVTNVSEGSGVMNIVSMDMVKMAGCVLSPFLGDHIGPLRFVGVEQQPYPRGGGKKQQIKMWTFAHSLGAHITGIALGSGNVDVTLYSISAQGRSIESEKPPIFHKEGKKRTPKEYKMKKDWAVEQCLALVSAGAFEWFANTCTSREKTDDLADAFLLSVRAAEKHILEKWSLDRKVALEGKDKKKVKKSVDVVEGPQKNRKRFRGVKDSERSKDDDEEEDESEEEEEEESDFDCATLDGL